MGYMRVGSCNHCGKCCKPPIIIQNPCIELGEDRCKFYTEIENSELYGHCLIKGSWAPIEFARDRFGSRITQGQIQWFNDNCLDFPKVEDAGKFVLPSECSFSFEVV